MSVQGGIWVPGQKALGGFVVDEGVLSEPLHRSAPGTGIVEGVPHWHQIWIILVEFVFEPAECSLALDGACQRRPPKHAFPASRRTENVTEIPAHPMDLAKCRLILARQSRRREEKTMMR